jgi:hypothetical protein
LLAPFAEAIGSIVVPVTVKLRAPLVEASVVVVPKYCAVMECVPIAPRPLVMDTVPLVTGAGRPSAVPASRSCTCPVGAAPDEVTVTVKAKSFIVEGNFVADTVTDVCVVAVPPPPPPSPLLPPPQPSAKLSMQARLKPNVARICFRPRSPGKTISNKAHKPVPALRVHQRFAVLPRVLAFGIAAAVANRVRAGWIANAERVADGAATETVNCPVTGAAPGTVMVSGFGMHVTPGGKLAPWQVICISPGVAPAPGVTVIVDTALAPAVTVTGVPLIV